jgi:hypothetical protein
MADTSKFKERKSRMPGPLPPEQARRNRNLNEPETAPAAEPARQRRDGRSLRATGRTHPFATRIKPETHEKMLDIAERDGITLGELIEKAIEVYERG